MMKTGSTSGMTPAERGMKQLWAWEKDKINIASDCVALNSSQMHTMALFAAITRAIVGGLNKLPSDQRSYRLMYAETAFRLIVDSLPQIVQAATDQINRKILEDDEAAKASREAREIYNINKQVDGGVWSRPRRTKRRTYVGHS